MLSVLIIHFGFSWVSNETVQCRVINWLHRPDGLLRTLGSLIRFSDLRLRICTAYVRTFLNEVEIQRLIELQAMHGSSSGSYTVTGEFDQARFNSIFDTYSSEPHTHLTFWEGVRMIRGNRNLFDFVSRQSVARSFDARTEPVYLKFGWFSACFEWLATWILLRDKDPKGLKREDVKGVLMVS